MKTPRPRRRRRTGECSLRPLIDNSSTICSSLRDACAMALTARNRARSPTAVATSPVTLFVRHRSRLRRSSLLDITERERNHAGLHRLKYADAEHSILPVYRVISRIRNPVDD